MGVSRGLVIFDQISTQYKCKSYPTNDVFLSALEYFFYDPVGLPERIWETKYASEADFKKTNTYTY